MSGIRRSAGPVIGASSSSSSEKGAQNRYIIFISLCAFILNQVVEFIILRSNGHGYDALCIFDCRWYSSIVMDGYALVPSGHEKGDAANWAFFPLSPLVATGVRYLTGVTGDLALIISSRIFFLLSICAFVKLCLIYSPRVSIIVCALVAVYQPYAIYGNVGYTEPMFLLGTCLSLICMKQRRYVLAGIFGGALSAVRAVGVALCLSYAVLFAKDVLTKPGDRYRIILGAMLLPLGLSFYMLFLHFWMGDALAFSHIQRAWHRQMQNPFSVLWNNLYVHPQMMSYYFSILICIISIFYNVMAGRAELAVFSLFCMFIPLSTGIDSMSRYIWWQAPVLLAASEFVSFSIFRISSLSNEKKWLWVGASVIFSMMTAVQFFMVLSWVSVREYMI